MLGVLGSAARAQQSEGPNNPMAAANLAPGGATWFPPGQALVSDDLYASVSPGGSPTEFLTTTNYGFSIPSAATIVGIQVAIERHASNTNAISDTTVQLVKGGITLVGTNHALAGKWPTTDTVATYGGPADLWGTTWTPTDINASGFGVGLSVDDTAMTAAVDVMTIQVFYSLCPAAPRVGCKTAGKSLLIIKDKPADHTKDKLIWKWIKGQPTALSDLLDPLSTAQYSLCLYENGVGTETINVLADSTKWQTIDSKGFKYKDPGGTQDGVQKIILKGSTDNKSKILVKGKGANLPVSAEPTLTLPVTVQLVNSDTGVCFTSNFTTAKKNVTDLFKAKNP
jgi:hypothetical protein